ncbi:MAG: hypothetical protein L3K23_09945 [Thermoplasmata archaeon]|nr:hypothetical protein [Thermoplasmata archaeon]
MAAPANPPTFAPETPSAPASGRRCSSCTNPLVPLGPRPFRTAAVGELPEAVVTLELFFCSQCGKVEFYSTR